MKKLLLAILSAIFLFVGCTTQMFTPTEYEFEGPGVILESSQNALGASSMEMLLCYGYNKGYKYGIILGEKTSYSTYAVPHFYSYLVQGPIAPLTMIDSYYTSEISSKCTTTILFTNDKDLVDEAFSQGFKSLRTFNYKDTFKNVDRNEALVTVGSVLLGGVTIGVMVSCLD